MLITPSSAAGANYPQTHRMSPSLMLAACIDRHRWLWVSKRKLVPREHNLCLVALPLLLLLHAASVWPEVPFERKLYVSLHCWGLSVIYVRLRDHLPRLSRILQECVTRAKTAERSGLEVNSLGHLSNSDCGSKYEQILSFQTSHFKAISETG